MRIRAAGRARGLDRLIDHDESLRVLPRLYDRVRKRTPGFVSRSTRLVEDAAAWRPARSAPRSDRSSARSRARRRAVRLRPLPDRAGGVTFAEWSRSWVVEVQGIDERPGATSGASSWTSTTCGSGGSRDLGLPGPDRRTAGRPLPRSSARATDGPLPGAAGSTSTHARTTTGDGARPGVHGRQRSPHRPRPR